MFSTNITFYSVKNWSFFIYYFFKHIQRASKIIIIISIKKSLYAAESIFCINLKKFLDDKIFAYHIPLNPF